MTDRQIEAARLAEANAELDHLAEGVKADLWKLRDDGVIDGAILVLCGFVKGKQGKHGMAGSRYGIALGAPKELVWAEIEGGMKDIAKKLEEGDGQAG